MRREALLRTPPLTAGGAAAAPVDAAAPAANVTLRNDVTSRRQARVLGQGDSAMYTHIDDTLILSGD